MTTQLASESTTDQILGRLTALEVDVAVIKSNYATKEDIARVQVEIAKTHDRISQTHAQTYEQLSQSHAKTYEHIYQSHTQVLERMAQMDERISQMEVRLLKWFIGTAMTLAGLCGSLAFLVARYIH